MEQSFQASLGLGGVHQHSLHDNSAKERVSVWDNSTLWDWESECACAERVAFNGISKIAKSGMRVPCLSSIQNSLVGSRIYSQLLLPTLPVTRSIWGVTRINCRKEKHENLLVSSTNLSITSERFPFWWLILHHSHKGLRDHGVSKIQWFQDLMFPLKWPLNFWNIYYPPVNITVENQHLNHQTEWYFMVFQ